jgi:hypothetical protein
MLTLPRVRNTEAEVFSVALRLSASPLWHVLGPREPRQLLRSSTISENVLPVSVLVAYLQHSVRQGRSQFFLRQIKRLK